MATQDVRLTITLSATVPTGWGAEDIADAVLDNLDFARLPFEVEITWEEDRS